MMIIASTKIENPNWNASGLITVVYAPRNAPAMPPNAAPIA